MNWLLHTSHTSLVCQYIRPNARLVKRWSQPVPSIVERRVAVSSPFVPATIDAADALRPQQRLAGSVAVAARTERFAQSRKVFAFATPPHTLNCAGREHKHFSGRHLDSQLGLRVQIALAVDHVYVALPPYVAVRISVGKRAERML